jgi:hypothetical protein
MKPISLASRAAIILLGQWLVTSPLSASAGQPPPPVAVPVLVPPAKIVSLHRPQEDWKVVTTVVLRIEPTTEPNVDRTFRWVQPNSGGAIVCADQPGSATEVTVPAGTSSVTCSYQPATGFKGTEKFAYSAKFKDGAYANDAVVDIEVRERGLRWEFKTNASTITNDSPDPDALAGIPEVLGGTSQDFLFTVNWQTMRPRRRLEDTNLARRAGLLQKTDLKVRPSLMSRATNLLIETGVQSEAVAATVTDVGPSATGGDTSEPAAGTSEQPVARRTLVLRGEFNYNATLNADGVGRLVEIGALGKGGFNTVLDSDESFKEAVGRVLQVVPKDRTAFRADVGVRLAVKQAHELDTTTVVSPSGQVEPPTNIENALLLEFVPLRFDTAVTDVPTGDGSGDSRRRWAVRAEFSPEIDLLPGHQAPAIGIEVSGAWAGGPVAVKITYGMNLSASKGIFKR